MTLKRQWGLISEPQVIDEGSIDEKWLNNLPSDLYIPPDAMRVLLDSFTGPLDLLLYLIRKQNIDILDIPILKITEQYLSYIEVMEANRFELAADYLLMAATLAEIKSRMLLPASPAEEYVEDDPRMALVRQLQNYEKIKQASQELAKLPYQDYDFYGAEIMGQGLSSLVIYPTVEIDTLQTAMNSVILRQSHRADHQIQPETYSVNDRIASILSKVKAYKTVSFYQLFTSVEGRHGLVVSMLAILELAKAGIIILEQDLPYAPLTIRV